MDCLFGVRVPRARVISKTIQWRGWAGKAKSSLPDLFGYHTCPGLASHRLNGHVWAQLVRHHVRLTLVGWLAALPDSYELSARPTSIPLTWLHHLPNFDFRQRKTEPIVAGNVQQHCHLHCRPPPGGKPQPERDAHIPMCQCQRQVRSSFYTLFDFRHIQLINLHWSAGKQTNLHLK